MILAPSWDDKNSTHEYTCHNRNQIGDQHHLVGTNSWTSIFHKALKP
jgi:hypothetical protein